MTEIASCLSTILDRLRVLMLAMWQLAVLIASWKYFPHVAIAAAAVVELLS